MPQTARRDQPFTIADGLFVGEAISILFKVFDDDGDELDPTGWTTELKVGASQGSAAAVTVAGTESSSGITCALTAANMTSIGVGTSFYTLSRTDVGSERVLAYGDFIVQGRLS